MFRAIFQSLRVAHLYGYGGRYAMLRYARYTGASAR